jgi:mannose-1-phosphate guanylyltransferase
VLVVTSKDIASAIHAAIPEVPAANMLIEPRPLGTAAALAWGAHEVAKRAGPETIFCCLHADLAVGFPELFRQVVTQASRLAATSPVLVAVGVKPTRPETSFGYLAIGSPLSQPTAATAPAYRVETVVDRPGPILAETLIADGALWNAGIFVFRAGVVLDSIEELTAELAPGLDALKQRDFETYAGSIQSVSIERGILERSNNVVTVVGDFQWDDVGTWASLRRARELDDTGNGAIGTVHFVDSASNVVHAEGGTVVLYGCSHMLVVSLNGLTFVTPLERATDLRPLLDSLPNELRVNPGG